MFDVDGSMDMDVVVRIVVWIVVRIVVFPLLEYSVHVVYSDIWSMVQNLVYGVWCILYILQLVYDVCILYTLQLVYDVCILYTLQLG